MKDRAPKDKDNVLWLEVTHSARFDDAAIEDWRARLQAHLAASGLTAAISPNRIAVLAMGRSIGPAERGAVLGWLVSQPEFVLIRIERNRRLGSVDIEVQPKEEKDDVAI